MIGFPPVDAPEVTVAMAVYGRWDWVERALGALRDATPPVYEVVVVYSASPDGSGDRLAAEVDGITLLRNDTNEGFGRAINRAAQVAKGEHLCILNSDALVQDGWLPPLLAAMDDPAVGVALPLYLSMEETVLEAGSTVGADGVTVPIGRGCAPDAPEVRFPRVVDFGSAACMVVRTEAFRAVGGFAEAYGLGYYEDTELCFALRERGLRSVYVPGATVQHGLGASLSKEEAKARSDANRPVLLARRAADLVGRPELERWEDHPHRLVHARDRLAPIRVLVVAERLPLDGPAAAAAVDALGARPDARVTVAVGTGAADADVTALLDRGVEVVPDAQPQSVRRWPGAPWRCCSWVRIRSRGSWIRSARRNRRPPSCTTWPVRRPVAGQTSGGSRRSRSGWPAWSWPRPSTTRRSPGRSPRARASSWPERTGRTARRDERWSRRWGCRPWDRRLGASLAARRRDANGRDRGVGGHRRRVPRVAGAGPGLHAGVADDVGHLPGGDAPGLGPRAASAWPHV